MLPVQWTMGEQPSDEPESRTSKDPRERFLSERDAATLSRYMREAVTVRDGTIVARQRHANRRQDRHRGSRRRPGALVVCRLRAVRRYRKIAFAVIVENAGYGARAAAPIAGEIVSAARELNLIK